LLPTESKFLNFRNAEERLVEYTREHRVKKRNFDWLKEETEGDPKRKKKRDHKYKILKAEHAEVSRKHNQRRQELNRLIQKHDDERTRLKKQTVELHREIYSESEEDTEEEKKNEQIRELAKKKREKKMMRKTKYLYKGAQDYPFSSSEEEKIVIDFENPPDQPEELTAPLITGPINTLGSLIK
jgi:hypothetical protein